MLFKMGTAAHSSAVMYLAVLAVLSAILLPEAGLAAVVKKNKVLLVSMDGFRYDYLTKAKTSNFDQMIKEGVTMPYMNSTYVTLTFPCHYSMVTGVYEESHGIVANTMYDPDFNAFFGMGNTEERWWNGSEPIWAGARRAGLKSGVFFWPGSEAVYAGHRPDEYRPYNGSVPYEERVKTVVGWLANDNFDLGLLYFDEPDHKGHEVGPDSPELVPVIERMDGILGLITQELKEAGIYDVVNLIVTSDHGMAEVNASQVVNVKDYTDNTTLRWMPRGGVVTSLRPQDGQADALKANLSQAPNLKVMLKEEIPPEKHYTNHRRIMPVVAEADEGWEIAKDADRWKTWIHRGNHGYNNDYMSMKPIFVARGPDFKKNVVVNPIKNIDIYPLICHLLDIQPAPNNGSFIRASQLLLVNPGNSASVMTLSVFGMFLHLIKVFL